jgi:hypothetical protein
MKIEVSRCHSVVFLLVLVCAACGDEKAMSPSPVPMVVSGDISGSMILQTVRQRVSMCVPSEGFHTSLTCFITEPCGSVNVVQLTITMNVQTDTDGKMTGTADVAGRETIGVCFQ